MSGIEDGVERSERGGKLRKRPKPEKGAIMRLMLHRRLAGPPAPTANRARIPSDFPEMESCETAAFHPKVGVERPPFCVSWSGTDS